MKGTVFEILELKNNKFRVSIDVEGADDLNNIAKYKENKTLCNIEIKKHREKRSLNANAYAWVLIEKIAEKMKMSKEDIYKRELCDYGTIATDDDGRKIIFSLKADIDVSKYFKYYKELGYSKDKKFKHYYVLKGSSEYDSNEMSKFIDGIVQDCQTLGIETMTPEEIAKLEAGND
ncbi:MAG: hypothetical protein IKB70_00415 [Bacilli bacterium]|nr:hypothetical protein [Bacilli bacterium]